MGDRSTVSSINTNYDFIFKIVLVGDSGVGKTNLLTRYTQDLFDVQSKSTIGVEFATKSEKIDGHIVKSQIWDTAGQERFRSLTSAYYRGAGGALLVFDLSNYKSFKNCERWVSDLKENSSSTLTIILIGNKSDLSGSRVVPDADVKSFAEDHGLLYVETSAASGNNVEKAFKSLLKKIYSRVKETVNSKVNVKQSSGQQLSGIIVQNDTSLDKTQASCCSIS